MFSPEQHNMANIEEIKEEYSSYIGLVLCYQDPERMNLHTDRWTNSVSLLISLCDCLCNNP